MVGEERMRVRLQRLGEAVRDHRTRVGLTQDQLGAGQVTKSFISQLERGSVSPSLTTLFHMADTLDVPASHLIAESDVKQQAEAILDMAEAALVVDGSGAANRWIGRVEEVMPIPQLADYGLQCRWRRYNGLARLHQGKLGAAISLLESAQPEDDPVAAYWLGLAHRQAGHLLQALRAWESIVPERQRTRAWIPPLLQLASRSRLVELYKALDDDAEALNATDKLAKLLDGDHDAPTAPSTPLHHADKESVLQAPTQRPKHVFRDSFVLAKLLWRQADALWRHSHVLAAAAYARIVPLLKELASSRTTNRQSAGFHT